ncbi:MAG: response regulator transcription factor, partial [Oscillospiraceae bacterium]|nr:response regulator transcription factor [Oscillospiraceae bacterium]
MDKIKVLIADDSDFVRDGMKIILDVDDDFDVIGCASNGREACEIAEKTPPDVFLMDIQMPVMDGIEATEYITKHDLGKVLILTTFDEDELVQAALRNGAKGYLIKNHTPEHLKQMIRSVYYGTGVMEESILESLARNTEPAPSGF